MKRLHASMLSDEPNELTLSQSIEQSRQNVIKRWIVDPQITRLPDNVTFGEMHAALDEILDRIEECREMYPVFEDD